MDSVSSIVIPVMNQVHFTQMCFASLLEGAHFAHELIVIDNHSTDDTPRFLQEFKKTAESKNWIVKIISNPENVGVGAAFNQGIKASNSDFIFLANNDTWVMPQWDEALLSAIERLGADAVGPHYDESPFDPIKTPLKAQKFIRRNYRKFSPQFMPIVICFKRTVFEKIGFFDERFFVTYEDRDLRERMDRAELKYYTTADCFIWHHSKGTRDTIEICPSYEQKSLAKFIEKWGFDPRSVDNTPAVRRGLKWKRFKNRLGLF